jgi:hypothetical protein
VSEQPTGVMRWLTGSPRPHDELLHDANLPYQLGRLVGAATMAAHLLGQRDDPEVKAIGDKLAEIVGWFYEGPPTGGRRDTKAQPRGPG